MGKFGKEVELLNEGEVDLLFRAVVDVSAGFIFEPTVGEVPDGVDGAVSFDVGGNEGG